MKSILPLLIVALTFLGILDASYVTWTKYSGVVARCQPPFACDTVLKSAWSNVGPVPLSVLGLLFYSLSLVIAAVYVLEITEMKLSKYSISVPALIFGLGSFGAAFSLYLIFIMGVVLQAWCLYCLLSAINCAIVFIISLGVWRNAHCPGLLRKEAHALHL